MSRLSIFRPGIRVNLHLGATLLLASVGCMASVACNVHTGSGIIETESREIDDVSRIDVCCGFQVDVTRGKKPAAKITTDQELLDQVTTEIDGDTLVIAWKGDYGPYKPSHGVQIQLTLPELSSVAASGGSNVTVDALSGATSTLDLSGGSALSLPEGELNADDVSITLSGASHLDIVTASLAQLDIELSSGSVAEFGALNSTTVTLTASGGSRLDAEGIGDDLDVNASGGSQVNLKDLAERRVKIDASGGSKVSVDAREQLDIVASGGSQVTFPKEPPKFTAELSGGSTATPEK